MADGLVAVLRRARELGFLGPGEPEAHLQHALAFAEAYEASTGGPPQACCDLGAGGGVPGLLLARRWPTATVVLLEASARRCSFLRAAIAELDLAASTSVAEGRAERLARTGELEGCFELVTARSFGRPAATAECATRLLCRPSGLLLVADPPASSDAAEGDPRWPQEGLAVLGLRLVGRVTDPSLAVIEAAGRCPERFPRRDGVPARRALF